MIKKLVALALLLFALVMVFRFELLSQGPFLGVTNTLKLSYQNVLESASEFIETYFQQATTIQRLRSENEQLSVDNQVLSGFATEVVNLSKMKGVAKPLAPKVRIVRAVSYAALPDFQKIWIDYDSEANSTKVRGLVYNNMTAGIVVKSVGSQSMALLNGDPKCSYAVYIGEGKVPGIVMGRSSEEMIVRYIPAWRDVNEGEMVVTSGLDNIFFPGITVGVITKVYRQSAYKEALVKPAYNGLNPDYFYLVESAK